METAALEGRGGGEAFRNFESGNFRNYSDPAANYQPDALLDAFAALPDPLTEPAWRRRLDRVGLLDALDHWVGPRLFGIQDNGLALASWSRPAPMFDGLAGFENDLLEIIPLPIVRAHVLDPIIGRAFLDAAQSSLGDGDPLILFEDLRAWIRAQGRGVLVLDWNRPAVVHELADCPRILAASETCARRLDRALRRTFRRLPEVRFTEASHAA